VNKGAALAFNGNKTNKMAMDLIKDELKQTFKIIRRLCGRKVIVGMADKKEKGSFN